MLETRDLTPSDQAKRGRIRPSRLVAGVALHFAVPAYLVWLAVALLPWLGGSSNTDRLAAAAGHASVQFILIYLGILAAIILGVRAVEPALETLRDQRALRDPTLAPRLSKAHLSAALKDGSRLGTLPSLVRALERLGAAPWKHQDQRFQAISADLARAAESFAAGYDAATVSERDELQGLAARSFDRLADAVEQLAEEERRLDRGDARTIARYIELRYPTSDSASGQND